MCACVCGLRLLTGAILTAGTLLLSYSEHLRAAPSGSFSTWDKAAWTVFVLMFMCLN